MMVETTKCCCCTANKSEIGQFLPKITKDQKWSQTIFYQHPYIFFHLRYPLTKRLMSAKSKTASTSQKDELHFVLMKSTRNSDCLLPFVCHTDTKRFLNPSGLAKQQIQKKRKHDVHLREYQSRHCRVVHIKATRLVSCYVIYINMYDIRTEMSDQTH